MKAVIITNHNVVDVEAIHSGNLLFLSGVDPSNALVAHAIATSDRWLSGFFDEHGHAITEASLPAFVKGAIEAKKEFTNGEKTKRLLLDLISQRYDNYRELDLFFDLPRLRIIPPSYIYKSGASYNYQPHRDSWYAATTDQINHWIAVRNVTADSTFYIAPSFFDITVPNTSHEFDLDVWNSVHRPAAEKSTYEELRPHPSPTVDIPDGARVSVVMDTGNEVVFSGTHLHGSTPNLTDRVRLSIDYRVVIPALSDRAPMNIDSAAVGDYNKYLVKHPDFHS